LAISLARHTEGRYPLYTLVAVLQILLFLLPVAASMVSARRIYAILFSLIVLVYRVTFGTYAANHYHSRGGTFLSIPFWFAAGQRFGLTWQAVRYYFLLCSHLPPSGSYAANLAFDPHQMSHMLTAQHAQHMYDYPDSIFTQLHSYLIAHYRVSSALLLTMVLVQLSFVGGFFT
jgi:hypothetical protein